MTDTSTSRRFRTAERHTIAPFVLVVLASSLTLVALRSQAGAVAAEGLGREQPARPAQTQPTTKPALASAPATQPVQKWPPQPGSCITSECHQDLSKLTHRHDPVQREACQECHGPEQPEHKFPLLREGTALCTTCHPAAGKKHVHAVITDDGCLACHNPHGSNTKSLLTGESVAATCLDCHELERKEHTHDPFESGECTSCHDPHESDYASLLLYGKVNDLCFECHEDVKDQLADAQAVHDPANEDCASCHEAHSSDQAYLLNAPADEICLECHDEQGTLIGGPHDRSRNPQAWPAAAPDSKCLACHVPHASKQPGLFRIAPAKGRDLPDAACLACHPGAVPDSGGAIALTHPSAARKLPDKHGLPVVETADGRWQIGCRTCHVPHGGAKPAHLTRGTPGEPLEGLCIRCHPNKMRIKRSGHAPEKLAMAGFATDTCKPCHAVHAERSKTRK